MLSMPLASGCFDPLLTPSSLDEHPRVGGIAAEVIEDSPHIPMFAPLAAGYRRAELLPLDRAELSALVVTEDGPVDLDATEAVWLRCYPVCAHALFDSEIVFADLKDCDADAPWSENCKIGEGATASFSVPLWEPDEYPGPLMGVMLVTGIPGEITTDECLEGYFRTDRPDLQGCAFGQRSLPLGPLWGSLWRPDEEPRIPDAIVGLLSPNVAPEVKHILVSRPGVPEAPERWAIDETIVVPTETSVQIEPEVTPQTRQIELRAGTIPGSWLGRWESYQVTVLVDHPGAVPTSLNSASYFRFEAPPTPGTMQAYMTVRDDRGAVSWFTLNFEFVEP